MKVFKVFFLTLTLLTSSISLSQQLEGENNTYTIEELRNIFQEFNEQVSLTYYRNDAYGEEIDTTRFTDEYNYILTDRTLLNSLWEGYMKESDPELKESYLRFYKELSTDIIWQNLRAYLDELYNLEASLEVYLDDTVIAYRDVGTEIYISDDRNYRRELYEAIRPATLKYINPLLRTIVDEQRKLCRELGFADYDDYWQNVHSLNFDEFSHITEQLLFETNTLFREMLEERVGETLKDLKIEDIKPYDRSQLFRIRGYDELFTKEKMLPTMKNFLLGLGINLENQKNINIDFSDIPEKGARASTYIIRVPSDIRVLGKPSAGIDDYAALFHEMGHAQHYANTKEPRYEFHLLGDGGLSECYAFLFEEMLMDPLFLTEEIGVSNAMAKQIVRRNLFSYLYSLRYYITLFNYERGLHQGVEDPVELYRELMETNLLLPRTREDAELGYLSANEDFYSVYYLEAWFASVMLRRYLEDNYGRRWYKNKKAGEFLMDLWATGERYSTRELIHKLGYNDFEVEPVINYIEQRYQFSAE